MQPARALDSEQEGKGQDVVGKAGDILGSTSLRRKEPRARKMQDGGLRRHGPIPLQRRGQ